MNYIVTLTHTEVISVEAQNESDALHIAYKAADSNCVWDECDVEEVGDEDD